MGGSRTRTRTRMRMRMRMGMRIGIREEKNKSVWRMIMPMKVWL